MQFVLASASPRRKQLIEQLGILARILPVDINEDPLSGEDARDYVMRMAHEKLSAALGYCSDNQQGIELPALVLTSDTSVIVDGRILGKPESQADHYRMMKLLSGRAHEVVSSYALGHVSSLESSMLESSCISTQVWFKSLTDDEIAWYWQTGEPADKAGGYGIQGIASLFIEKINGSYTNVVGLPLMQVSSALQRHGLQFIR